MASVSPNDPCPCGSARKYKKCCGPAHAGVPAPTAEALMRSRYSAYALGEVRYLVATTHPASVHHQADTAAWLAELRAWCAATTFEGLRVLSAHEAGDVGRVHFEAALRQGGVPHTLVEHSRFRRVAGRWYYLDGDAEP